MGNKSEKSSLRCTGKLVLCRSISSCSETIDRFEKTVSQLEDFNRGGADEAYTEAYVVFEREVREFQSYHFLLLARDYHFNHSYCITPFMSSEYCSKTNAQSTLEYYETEPRFALEHRYMARMEGRAPRTRTKMEKHTNFPRKKRRNLLKTCPQRDVCTLSLQGSKCRAYVCSRHVSLYGVMRQDFSCEFLDATIGGKLRRLKPIESQGKLNLKSGFVSEAANYSQVDVELENTQEKERE